MQASYGVAMGSALAIKKTATGRNIWHFGNWQPRQPDVTPNQFASYFALWSTGDLFVMLMDRACVDDNQQASLYTALRTALGIP